MSDNILILKEDNLTAEQKTEYNMYIQKVKALNSTLPKDLEMYIALETLETGEKVLQYKLRKRENN